jgi:drug/metabolite transporter (DMT)-like permease
VTSGAVRSGAAPGRTAAVGIALFVTFLWSTSWVLIKVGLDDLSLPPLGFAGARYVLASAVLLPFALPAIRRAAPWRGGRSVLARVLALGVVLYAGAQGAQTVALDHAPAATVGLILAISPVAVALIGIRRAQEPPTALQVLGIALLLGGVTAYFGVAVPDAGAILGVAVASVGMLATAVGAVLGRDLARDALDGLGGVLGMTTLSMTVGGLLLLGTGIVLEGPPAVGPSAWLVTAWLAVVNTALAFTLWNHTLRRLSAVESSVLNNLMLVQIATLAWIFLGEALDAVRIAALALALVGVALVQVAPALVARRAAEPTATRG